MLFIKPLPPYLGGTIKLNCMILSQFWALNHITFSIFCGYEKDKVEEFANFKSR